MGFRKKEIQLIPLILSISVTKPTGGSSMGYYSVGRDEMVFVVPETGYGQMKEPDSDAAVRHLSCTLKFDRPRAARADKSPTRGTAEMVTRARKGEWSVGAYVAPSGVEGQEPDIKDLIASMNFDKALATQAATVAESPAPTASSFAISPIDAAPVGAFLRIGSEVRMVESNVEGLITVSRPFSSAPVAGQAVGSTVCYRPLTQSLNSFTLWRFGTNGGQAHCGCISDKLELKFTGGEEAKVTFSGFSADETIIGSDALACMACGHGFSQSGLNPSKDLYQGGAGADNKFKISVDSGEAQEVTLDLSQCATASAIAGQMQTAIRALGGAFAAVTVSHQGTAPADYYLVAGSTTDPASSVAITDASANNCADDLKLGVANNGVEMPFSRIRVASASKFEASAVLIVDSEKMKIDAADAEASELQVQRGYGGSAAGSHSSGATISPFRPDPNVSGSPVPGISGSFFVGNDSMEITEATVEISEAVKPLDKLFGEDKSVGATYSGGRAVKIKAKALVTTDFWSLYGKAKRFEPGEVFIQAGEEPGRIAALLLPKVEWKMPQISMPAEGESIVDLEGTALETVGNDEVFLAFA